MHDTLEAAPPREDPIDSAKRRQIIDGARQVFLAQGFDAASMGEIARAAGVSKGTLYVYFENKDELFEALVKSQCAMTAERLFELDADNHDVREVLTRLGVSYLEAMVEPTHVATMRMVIGAAFGRPELGQLFLNSGPRTGAQRLAAWLDAKVAQGDLVIGDVETAAWQFLTICKATVMMPVLIGDEPRPTPQRLDYLVSSAVDLFLAGYGPKAAAAH